MKNYPRILLGFIAVLTFTFSFAQDIPKTGAVIRVDADQVHLLPGETFETTFTIVRSRADRRTKFETPVVQELEGLHASVSTTDQPDVYLLKLTPTTLEEGSHLLIIKGSGPNRRYLTSKALSVKMTGGESVASVDQ
ncbi:MAG: hypothetical protein RIC30_07855 [Marinoscillum sp.]|uniref:hypothetical protein n=1 Tax=Marinoscillum sp. TaxID=2024838 RepID=UPI0032F39337